MINITCCSNEFAWESDWNPEDYGYDPESVDHVMEVTCPNCGRSLTIVYHALED